MKKFLVIAWFTLLAICGGAFLFTLASCSSNHHAGPTGNLYLTDVLVAEDNSVTAVINLPDLHYGLLTLDGSNVALAIVIGSGDVELGVFEAGDYNLCLELFLRPDVSRDRTGRVLPLGTQDLTGLTECLGFGVPKLAGPEDPQDPEDPVEPPEQPGKPLLTCVLNEDGAAALVVELRGHNPVLLRRLFDEENDFVVDGDLTVADLPLDPGTYLFQLISLETGEELANCELVVPAPPGDDDDDDVPELPPRPDDPRTRYVICHHGKTLLVPWPALKAHIIIHGDNFGPCD